MPLASRSGSAWAQITLPEVLLLGERLCRDVRREALCHIPRIRALRLNHLLWVQRYGAAAQTGWRVGFGLWRFVRAALNPIQSAGQEPSGMIAEKTLSVLSHCLRAYATKMFVLEIGTLPSTSTPAGLRCRTTRCAPRKRVTRPAPPRRLRRCASF